MLLIYEGILTVPLHGNSNFLLGTILILGKLPRSDSKCCLKLA